MPALGSEQAEGAVDSPHEPAGDDTPEPPDGPTDPTEVSRHLAAYAAWMQTMQSLHNSDATEAPFAEVAALDAQREREQASEPRPEPAGLPSGGFAHPFRFALEDVLAAHFQKVCDKGLFKGTDDADTLSSHRLALRIYTELPTEWKHALGSFNELRPNPLLAERRAKRALQKMARCSPGLLYGMLAGIHAVLALEEEECASFFPPTPDVIVECLEEYKENAICKAAERSERAEKAGKKSTGRGGTTATKRVRMGMYNLFKVIGLPGFHHANSDFAKDVAKHGPAMPRVQPLTPMQTMPHLERITLDTTKSEQFRARAGASWLRKAASPRTKDMLRTPSLSIDSVQVLGLATPVLSGTATKSKAREACQMQLLQWRVPLLPVGKQQDIDL